MMKYGLIIVLIDVIMGLDNGLGSVPQMGWNSWNKFRCNINEDVIRQTADQLVDLKLSNLGYEYINIDDCWQKEERSEDGHI